MCGETGIAKVENRSSKNGEPGVAKVEKQE